MAFTRKFKGIAPVYDVLRFYIFCKIQFFLFDSANNEQGILLLLKLFEQNYGAHHMPIAQIEGGKQNFLLFYIFWKKHNDVQK